jgi:hypothetical protein
MICENYCCAWEVAWVHRLQIGYIQLRSCFIFNKVVINIFKQLGGKLLCKKGRMLGASTLLG